MLLWSFLQREPVLCPQSIVQVNTQVPRRVNKLDLYCAFLVILTIQSTQRRKLDSNLYLLIARKLLYLLSHSCTKEGSTILISVHKEIHHQLIGFCQHWSGYGFIRIVPQSPTVRLKQSIRASSVSSEGRSLYTGLFDG